jgi:hypothetical protein
VLPTYWLTTNVGKNVLIYGCLFFAKIERIFIPNKKNHGAGRSPAPISIFTLEQKMASPIASTRKNRLSLNEPFTPDGAQQS